MYVATRNGKVTLTVASDSTQGSSTDRKQLKLLSTLVKQFGQAVKELDQDAAKPVLEYTHEGTVANLSFTKNEVDSVGLSSSMRSLGYKLEKRAGPKIELYAMQIGSLKCSVLIHFTGTKGLMSASLKLIRNKK